MKRIFLLCAAAMCLFAAEAQTTKKSKKAKKTTISAAAKAKADAAKLEEERQAKFEDERLERMQYDSARHENDRLADVRLDSERVAFKDTKFKEIDSTNKETWKTASIQKENALKAERNRDLINSKANLGPIQSRQAKDINLAYNDKAKAITDNASLSETDKQTQLAALNTERRDKIKAVLGKAREKRLEKERKDFVQKNGEDTEAAWIDQASGIAKNN
jgi:hypothetical protein